jgi:hypothetical protein
MKTKKHIVIELSIVTDKEELTIHRAIVRGLYMGFDLPTYRVASPNNVKIKSIKIN